MLATFMDINCQLSCYSAKLKYQHSIIYIYTVTQSLCWYKLITLRFSV